MKRRKIYTQRHHPINKLTDWRLLPSWPLPQTHSLVRGSELSACTLLLLLLFQKGTSLLAPAFLSSSFKLIILKLTVKPLWKTNGSREKSNLSTQWICHLAPEGIVSFTNGASPLLPVQTRLLPREVVKAIFHIIIQFAWQIFAGLCFSFRFHTAADIFFGVPA